MAEEGFDFGPDNDIGLVTCSEVVVVDGGNVSKSSSKVDKKGSSWFEKVSEKNQS